MAEVTGFDGPGRRVILDIGTVEYDTLCGGGRREFLLRP
jgi:hypothetical protein